MKKIKEIAKAEKDIKQRGHKNYNQLEFEIIKLASYNIKRLIK